MLPELTGQRRVGTTGTDVGTEVQGLHVAVYCDGAQIVTL